MASSCLKCSSLRISFSQIAWQAQAIATTSLALMVGNMTIGCFFDDHEKIAEAIINKNLDVLFLSSKNPI